MSRNRPSGTAKKIPKDPTPDATLALIRDPYGFIGTRCERFGTDLFEARIQLRRTVCMTGPEAAELFYNRERFVRSGAAPLRVQKTLFGKGGVQSLDGEDHRDRKRMLMSLMTPAEVERLGDLAERWFRRYAQAWRGQDEVVLYRQVREILCRAVCEWAAVPLPESEVEMRTHALTSLFESAGAVGPKHWRGRLDRTRSERWAVDLVERIRAGSLQVREGSAAHTIAMHPGPNARVLDSRIAAVELLNVLRPTVAVAVFVTFEALAMHQHPECRQKLRESDDEYLLSFVNEVRRFYPFFPAAVAVTRRDFSWRGHDFPQGRRVMLDLYGTNHDRRVWDEPATFRPERFRSWDQRPYTLIPQGGGDYYTNHRCAGEWLTIELMKRAAKVLANLAYEVPEQTLVVDLRRLPALPQSGFVIRGVAAG